MNLVYLLAKIVKETWFRTQYTIRYSLNSLCKFSSLGMILPSLYYHHLYQADKATNLFHAMKSINLDQSLIIKKKIHDEVSL